MPYKLNPITGKLDYYEATTVPDLSGYFLLAGRAGGQMANGGIAASENLTLHSTAHATKGKMLFDALTVDEVNHRVGVNNTSPLQSFDETGIFMVRGTYGSGEVLGVSGAGTRMFFYPRKSAFVVGSASSNQFDDANIGSYSVTIGNGVRTAGNGGITIGSAANNYAPGSLLLGSGSIAANDGDSIAIGAGNTLNGAGRNTAVGSDNEISNTASASSNAVVGSFNLVYGSSAVVLGNTCIVEDTCLFAGALGIYTLQRNATLGNMIFGIGDISVTGNPIVNAYDLTIALGIDTETPTMWITDGAVGGGYVGIGMVDPTTSTSNLEYQFSIYNNAGSYKLDLQLSINGTTALEYQSNTVTLYINQWYAVSISKLLSTAYFWLNGVTAGQFTVTSSALYAGSAVLSIGALLNATPTYYFPGYISNFKLTKGTGLYYLSYTPSTTQLTNTLNTQLLTLQYSGPITNNGFIDIGPFNNIVTRVGNATQGNFTPFSQNGWSIYFDGSSGYLSGAPTNTSNVNLSSGSFTVEAWIYVPVLTANQYVVNLSTGANSSSGLTFGINASGYPFIGNGSTTNAGSVAINLNAWNHIAVASDGTTCILYTNGTPNGSGVSFNPNSATYIYVGRDAAGTTYFNGYISNLRIVKGTRVYTTTFAPSTVPLIPIGNTVFLYAQFNRFVDNSQTNATLAPAGTVQVQAFSPFVDNTNIPVSYSAYFPGGTSTYITTAASQIIPASYPYTIDCWVNISTYASNPVIVSQGTAGNAGRTSFFINSSGYLSFGIGGTNITSSGTVPLNSWTYVAVVVGQNSATFYINSNTSGTSGITGTPQASPLVIGGDWQSSPSITGYMSNLRVSNVGRAIYTAPSTYFSSDIGCTLLAFVNNSSISDLSPSNNTLTITGVANILLSQFNPFNNTLSQPVTYSPATVGGSIYLNGVGDYLSLPASINNYFGTTNFTIEFWLYPSTLPSSGSNYALVDFWPLTNGNYLYGANTQWTTTLYSSGALQFIYATSATTYATLTTAKTINSSCWTHVAFVRNGNTLTVYINGIPDSATISLSGVNIGYTTYGASIGVETNTKPTGTLYNGYMSNIRINTYALYTTPFNVPTAPFSGNTSGTLLLLSGTAAGISDLGSRVNLITYNTSSSTNIYKYGLSSMYFNGTSSYTIAPYNPFYNLGSGNFTVDFWVYFNSTAANQQIISQYNATYFNWGIAIGPAGTLSYYLSSNGSSWNIANGVSMGTFTTGSWYHIALVRNGSVFTPYINGTAGTTSSSSSALYTVNAPLTVGALFNAGSSTFDTQTISTFANYFNGYLDDVRLTKGIARYTTGFTPPALGAFTQ